MENNLAAIYCRLSVEDIDKIKTGDDSESIQNQKLMLMDYAMSQNFSIYRVYSDDDYSGLDRNRPAFNRLIADAQAGLFRIILCKTQSRFTRDMELVEKYIHGYFPIWGIRFIGVIDNIDTAVKGNKKARQIYGLINEWYCEDLSENIRAVFRKKMQAGQFIGSFAPYGYEKDISDRHKLVVDHEAAKTVQKIFGLYLQGHGCRQIAHILTEMKIPTPTLYKQKKGYKFANPNAAKYAASYGIWSNNTIKRILQNRVYVGTLVQGKEHKISYKSTKVSAAPESDWIVVKNNHQAIINENTFDTVQSLMKNRRTTHRPKNGYSGHAKAHLLAGKVKCGDCLSNMTRSAPARNGEHYLRCALAYKTKAFQQTCSPHTIKLEQLIQIVEERVRVLLANFLSDEKEAAILKAYCLQQENGNSQISAPKKELSAVKCQSEKIVKAFTNAYLDKTTGLLSESEFLMIQSSLHDELSHLSQTQAALESVIAEQEATEHVMITTDTDGMNLILSQKLTHSMVNDFIDTIEVYEVNPQREQKVVIHWLF